MNRLLGIFTVGLCISGLLNACASEQTRVQSSPQKTFGVCAHAHKGVEWENAEKEIGICNSAGVRIIRDDFQFSVIAAKKGVWDFKKYDEFVDLYYGSGIEILAVLEGYDSEVRSKRPDATPLYEHPEEWRLFVRETVKRYHTRIKNWEVWNEQDGGFWKPKPDPEQYMRLLKIAYEEIKAIDPEAKVIIGGLCSWNSSYMKGLYLNGLKGNFDAVAVHPYGWGPDISQEQARNMADFKAIMKKEGDQNKEIWITESGGSTFSSALLEKNPDVILKAMNIAFKKIGRVLPLDKPITIGAPLSLSNVNQEFKSNRKYLPGVNVIPLSPDAISKLSPLECPAIIACEGLRVEAPYLEPMRDYVARGGLLLAFGQVPFYVKVYKDGDGNWQSADSADTLHPFFKIGFEAHWTKKGLPQASRTSKSASDLMPDIKNAYAARYLSPKNLSPNDSYVPLISQLDAKGNAVGEGLAIYAFADWKGAILAGTIHIDRGYTEEEQARIVQTMSMSYLASGINRIFIYDLHSDGDDPSDKESNFGLLRWNWKAKPAWNSYSAMITALGESPNFIGRIDSDIDDVQALVFKRMEDSKNVLALWSITGREKVTLCKGNEKTKIILNKQDAVFISLDSEMKKYRIEP